MRSPSRCARPRPRRRQRSGAATPSAMASGGSISTPRPWSAASWRCRCAAISKSAAGPWRGPASPPSRSRSMASRWRMPITACAASTSRRASPIGRMRWAAAFSRWCRTGRCRSASTAGRVEIVHKLTRQELFADAAKHAAFLAMLSPGDALGCDALLEMALTTAAHRDADFLYSDERRLNPASGKVEAFFKPQWSPDLMSSTNYVRRLWCARADLAARIAASRDDLLQYGDYDLALRCTEQAKAIRHVPAVLLERGDPNAADPKRDRLALERALKRRGIAGEVRPGLVAGTYRVKRALPRNKLVSIIIPTCAAQGLIKACIESLRRLTRYKKYEIICIENIPPADRKWRNWLKRNADRVVSTTEPYNWARFNNLAAKAAKGEFLLFLNDDIEIIEPDWLDTLLGEAQRPEVGAVGPLLLYPDRRIQHAGLFLAAMGQGRHAFYLAEDEPGYFGLARTPRNVIALT